MTITNFSLLDFESGVTLTENDLDFMFSGIHATTEALIHQSAKAPALPEGFVGSNTVPTIINNSLFSVNASGDIVLIPKQDFDDSVAAAAMSEESAELSAYRAEAAYTAILSLSVNIKTFGAIGDGVTDDTTAIQTALSSGLNSVFVPPGTYVCDNLLMPANFGFVFRGDGISSRLKQKSSANPLLRWNTAMINYTEGYVKDLAFIGTNGGNNTINTAGVGGLTLQNLYFLDVPAGFSSIYVNGAVATYVHDIRLRNIQIYSNTAGNSGIRFGALTSDSTVDGFIMNGGFTTDYCMLFDVGASTVRVSNSHPYNAKINVMKMLGGNVKCGFTAVTFDNALADIISMTGVTFNTFVNCHVQAVKSGYSGVVLNNCTDNRFSETMFDGAFGSLSCVHETGASNKNSIVGGNIDLAINFSAPFNLLGSLSYAKGLSGYADLGLSYSFSGCTSTNQAQNTTQFLGLNAGQTAVNNTAYLVPYNALVRTAYIAVGSTPAVGQTFTFNLKHGVTTIGTLVLTNGQFSGVITANVSVTQYSQISIESIFSATSGSSSVRYTVSFLS